MKLHSDREWLTEQYEIKRRRAEDIAEQCQVSRDAIFWWVQKFGLKRPRIDHARSKSRYSVKVDYFRNIDTEEKAYWLGFLAADGCVDNSKYRHFMQVELSSKDRDHLEALKKALGYGGPIHYDRMRKSFGKVVKCDMLRIACKELVADLVRHGVLPRKSKILQPPKIRKSLVRHWIRGYFDGDGSVSLVTTTGNICGSFFGTKEVTEFIAFHLRLNAETKIKAHARTYKGGWELCFNGNGVSDRIMKYLYKNASVYLPRKRNKFTER